MKGFWALLALIFLGCNISKKGVFFDEMTSRPVLKLKDNFLMIKTTNSFKNSALLIYKINLEIDSQKKYIYISANQAAGKKFQDTFAINLTSYKVIRPETFSFLWLDPDNKTTKLELTK